MYRVRFTALIIWGNLKNDLFLAQEYWTLQLSHLFMAMLKTTDCLSNNNLSDTVSPTLSSSVEVVVWDDTAFPN